MQSEKELIDGCAKGERAAQKALYDRYCRKMMVTCLRYTKSTQEAEDVLQEGFIKVFDNIKSFKGEAQLSTWMTRIIINTALNSQRQKLYLLPMVDVANVAIAEDENVSLSSFHFSELLEFIKELPDGCRVVFNLFAIEGFSHKEIAEMIGVTEGTSKSQFSRAKSLLRNKIEASSSKYEKFGESKI